MRLQKLMIYLGCLVFVSSFVALAQSANDMQQQTNKPAATTPKPRLSPPGEANCTFADGKMIKVAYSRPFMKDRKIMGGLVPYDQVWRTGANEATSFETSVALTVGMKEIPAGKYTLYTIPSENEWTLIINKQTGQWGTVYKEDQDFARVKMQVTKLDSPVEQFTISFDNPGKNTCRMKLEWENTSASVNFDEAAMTNSVK